MTLCPDCKQMQHAIALTDRKHLPVAICGCDVAPVWLLTMPEGEAKPEFWRFQLVASARG